MSEVLNNLLDNAFEAVYSSSSESRKIFLNIYGDYEVCVIEVGNTGKKIEINNIHKLFSREYTTKNTKNHGYGLYNVKKILDYYGGKIQLSHENDYIIFSLSVRPVIDKRPLMKT
jgi:sensor histidine kinase regulating citrate/malate metabolism